MENFGITTSPEATTVILAVCLFYILAISFFGWYFSRFNSDLDDFFFSGRRFSWWLPTISMVATGIGSYSYLKYSEQGFNTGISSTMTYTNDIFVLPFFLFGWLPLVYFSGIRSIPEYFQKRFNSTARYISLVIIMGYMFFYIGYNLYTIGVAVDGLFGIPQIYSVPFLALFLGFYISFGGQTAVIFTDLFQGIILYLAGFVAIGAGLYALGGLDEFWSWLPLEHRNPFAHLKNNPKFNTIGLFWGEALAGSIAFAFMNQGFIMRYLTIKDIRGVRKACLFNVLVTAIISTAIVGSLGWIGKSLIMKQTALGMPLEGYGWVEIENTFHTFIVVCWEVLKQNSWIFGFIIAALMAALMSTIDTLINACSAICIYDLYKPLIKPKASEKHYLKVARRATWVMVLVGVLLVIWFNGQKGSLMSIHYKGIMVITPPIVTAILLGAFWRGYTAIGACVSMVIGSIITLTSVWYPQIIDGLAEFVFADQDGVYIYMRALFGMLITGTIGVVVSLFTGSSKEREKVRGYTLDTLKDMIKRCKGSDFINLGNGFQLENLTYQLDSDVPRGELRVSRDVMKKLECRNGDQVYMSDQRWFLAGLRSTHLKITCDDQLKEETLKISKDTQQEGYFLPERLVYLERMF